MKPIGRPPFFPTLAKIKLTQQHQKPIGRLGFIDQFLSTTDFDVASLTVTTDTQTTFENGTSASLAIGVKVEVEGTIDENGILVASKIKIEQVDAARIEAIDTAAQTITILGIVIEIEAFTVIEDNSSIGMDPLTFSDLFIGDKIEMRGFVEGTRLIATEIEREDPDDRARLRGPVTAEVEPGASTTGTVDIFDITVSGESATTEYRNDADATITQTEFYDAVEIGTFVEARWDIFSDTSLTPDRLSLENDGD